MTDGKAEKRRPLGSSRGLFLASIFGSGGWTRTNDLRVINPKGRTGVIVPSGIATDDTTKHLFADLVEQRSLVSLFDFENREGVFPGVHRSYKFCLLTLTRSQRSPQRGEFAFFLHRAEQLKEQERRFALEAEDFRLLNPNTRTCPIFRTRRDTEITRAIYQRVPVLIDEAKGGEGNPWGIRFMAMLHMANDSHLFCTRQQLEAEGWRLEGNVFTRRGEKYLPLYEAKLIHQYDHRWATYNRSGQDTRDLTWEEKSAPDKLVQPRYWVPEAEVAGRLAGKWSRDWLLGWRDICRNTDERTVIASVVPRVGVGHTCPLFLLDESQVANIECLAVNLSCFALDYVARQKVGGTHLTYIYLKQLPILPPFTYKSLCRWSSGEALADWLAPRVLELTYTAWDLQPLAQDLGYYGPPFPWDEERRFLVRCELDSAFFHLYSMEREDVGYIMETFPIVKRRDKQRHGEYRTKRVIMEIYDAMQRAINTGQPYQTRLDPPPADPRVAHQVVEVRE